MAIVGGVLAACDHKDLCYDHPHAVPARINVDWSRFTQEQPTGMTVMLFPQDGGTPYTSLSNNTAYTDVNVPPDDYCVLVYNQSATEFGSLTFEGMGSIGSATVRAATMGSRWYRTRGDDARLVHQPEWFATDVQQDVVAPMSAIDKYTRAGTRSVIATLFPQCVVYTIHVRIHINNIYNLRSARASLDGLADGYLLGLSSPTSDLATELLEEWTVERDADNPANGTIVASITSFGLPAGHMGKADENHLRLSLLLVDNKTQLDHDFNVGSEFVRDSDVSLSLTINEHIDTPLPDVKPDGGSQGGFNASVDDWGDEENIDIGV